jgi:hypothetical protein
MYRIFMQVVTLDIELDKVCKDAGAGFFLFFSPPGATQSIVDVYFTALYRTLASSRTRLLDHTQRCVPVGRTHLNE